MLGLKFQEARVNTILSWGRLEDVPGLSWLPTRSSSARHMEARAKNSNSSSLADWDLFQPQYCVSSQNCAFIAR
jgi:hypothetical protein